MEIMMEHFEETLIELNNKLAKNNNQHHHHHNNNIVNMDINMMDKNALIVADDNNCLTMQHNIDDIDDLLSVDFGGDLLKNSEEELKNKTQNVKQLTITLGPANEPITTTTETNAPSAKTIDEIEMSTNSAKYKQQTETINEGKLQLQQPTPLNGELVDDENTDAAAAAADDDDDDEEEEEEEEDAVSSDSNISNLSEMSDMSGREWKPVCTRPIRWVQKQIQTGANPRVLLSQMLPAGNHQFAAHMNDMALWRILASILSEPPRRQKLRHINTFNDVVSLIKSSKNIIVLTGAGVSVSCGIPDFRSSDGIYARLAKDYPDLPDPQAMFDINYFARDPRPFYKFAREIYPGQFRPSPCHRFIKRLEDKQKLLRNYTQNIDTLEQVAGIRNVIECHGSFSTASCTKCKYKCSADDIRDDIFAQRIPLCPRCQPNAIYSQHVNEPVPSDFYLRRMVEHGIMKPDIVFFGEGLPEEFHTVMANDKTKCDLLIVIGSSLKVRPVALIPSSLPSHVPQILINREQLHHLEFDVQLLGDSDVIINQLCHRLAEDFTDICYNEKVLQESNVLQSCEGLLPLSRDSITSEISHNSDISTNTDETVTTEEDDDVDNDEDIKNVVVAVAVADVEAGEVEEEKEVKIINQLEAEEQFDVPQQLDTDSQSVKSNSSTDIALRSDSGFESSTSSGTNTNLASTDTQIKIIQAGNSVATTAIIVNEIQTSETKTISTTVINAANVLSDNAFVGEKSAQNEKHLDEEISAKEISITSKTPTPTIAETTLPESVVVVNNIKSSIQPCHKTVVKKHHKQKRRNTAECLLDGTYFCNDKKSAYVFPGAQVSWYTSSSSEDDDDEDDNITDDNDAKVNDNGKHNENKNSLDDRGNNLLHNSTSLTTSSTSSSPYNNNNNNSNKSTTQMTMHNKQIPLETLSAALAKATIPTPNTPSPLRPTEKAEKRRSDSDDNDHDTVEATLHNDHLNSCSAPPVKKRRDSNAEKLHNYKVEIENEEDEEELKRNISLTNCNKVQNVKDSVVTINPLLLDGN